MQVAPNGEPMPLVDPSYAALVLLCGAFFGGALLCWLAVPAAIALATRMGWVDRPGGRRVHEGLVPRAGGLAVFLGLVGGGAAYGFVFGGGALLGILERRELAGFFGPCLLIFLVGLLDDIRGLSPTTRLVVEAIAATGAIQVGYVIDHVATPFGTSIELGYLSYPFTVLWFLAVTNAFNLVDGLDGLLASVGITALAGCAVVGISAGMVGTPALALALAGALVGFLPWNWKPARIFLGDSGSLLIGFTIAGWSLKVSHNHNGTLAFHVPLLLCGLPLSEALLTVARRYVSGRPFFSGDRSHIHHVLVGKGHTVQGTVVALAGVSALLATVAVLSRFWREEGVLAVALALLLAAYLALRYLGYVELRVFAHRLRDQLLGRRRNRFTGVLSITRAGDVLRDVVSAEELAPALGRAVEVGGFSFIALEIEPSFTALAGLDLTLEARNEAANQLVECNQRLAILRSRPLPPDEQEQITVRVSAPLRVGGQVIGRLVCEGREAEVGMSPAAHDVARYLAEPTAGALARLVQADRTLEQV